MITIQSDLAEFILIFEITVENNIKDYRLNKEEKISIEPIQLTNCFNLLVFTELIVNG